MKKKLNHNHILYFNNHFPYKSDIKSKKINYVVLGIGGNIGDMKKRFNKLFLRFKSDSRFTILATSPLLYNPPFGYTQQEYFLNGIMVLKTDLAPFELLRVTQQYENRFKRERLFQDAPRTLDIDIIFFNKIKLNRAKLTIPHKGYKNRPSVQIPLRFV